MNQIDRHKQIARIGAGVGVLLLAVGLLFFVFRNAPQNESVQLPADIPAGPGQPMDLYFFDPATKDYRTTRVEFPEQLPDPEKIQYVVQSMYTKAATMKPPQPWPLPMRLRAAYVRKNGLLILDFEKSVQYNQAVDAHTEYQMVQSMLKTIHANFGTIREVKFLVGGQEAESFAGHVDISCPFDFKTIAGH